METFGDLELVTTNFGSKAKLYFEWALFYPHRVGETLDGTWQCVGCNVSVKTDKGRVVKKSTFPHFGHDHVSRDEVVCLATLNSIKQRVHDEPGTFCSVIFDDEIDKLQKVHGMSDETVWAYLKSYKHYKSTFECIRAQVRPALSDRNNSAQPVKKLNPTVKSKPDPLPLIKPDKVILSSNTEWLTASIIEKYLHKFARKLDFFLDAELSTSLAFQGVCDIGRRQLSKKRFVYGAVWRHSHWMAIFIDIEQRQFTFIDPYGATEDDQANAFANWISYVEHRKDLRELQAKSNFKQRSLDHPHQPKSDTSNCGVFVCRILQMLLLEQPLKVDSFDPLTVSDFRADIFAAFT